MSDLFLVFMTYLCRQFISGIRQQEIVYQRYHDVATDTDRLNDELIFFLEIQIIDRNVN